MSDFKAKMYQNLFRLRLRPRPRWRSLQRSPMLPSWNKGDLLLRKRDGAGKGRRGEGGEGGGGEEKGMEGPPCVVVVVVFSWVKAELKFSLE